MCVFQHSLKKLDGVMATCYVTFSLFSITNSTIEESVYPLKHIIHFHVTKNKVNTINVDPS